MSRLRNEGDGMDTHKIQNTLRERTGPIFVDDDESLTVANDDDDSRFCVCFMTMMIYFPFLHLEGSGW